MSTSVIELQNLINKRNEMLRKEKELYIATVEKLNINTRELLNNDFGSTLVKNTATDLVGEVARRFFDMGDYYITVDQLYDRFINFSYENDVDLLSSNEAIRKSFYNMKDSAVTSKALNEIAITCDNAQRKLFENDRKLDELDRKGKIAYRKENYNSNGQKYTDEITGEDGSYKVVTRNGKGVHVSEVQADHIQAREAAKYNERYIREDKIEQLKKFYNSSDNMQMMHESANASKSDVRVCINVNGEVEYINSKEFKSRESKNENIKDITHKATPQQLVEATISQWEKETESKKIETLKAKGYLDSNGKVKPNVKKELLNLKIERVKKF